MGFLDTMLNIAGEVLDAATEYNRAQREKQMEEEDRKQTEQVIELATSIKDNLKNLITIMDEYIQKIDELQGNYIENEVLAELIGEIEVVSSAYGDYDWFQKNCNVLCEDEEVVEEINAWKEMVYHTDGFFSETVEEEGVRKQHLEVDARRFAHRMHTVHENYDDGEDENELLESILKAVDDFKKSLKDAMKHWNKLLDVIYDELCENDYEE